MKLFAVSCLMLLSGCLSSSITGRGTGESSSSADGSSAAASASSSGGRAPTGTATASSTGGTTSSGSSGSTGSSTAGGGSSSTTGTSTGAPPPPIVDGGYVFCTGMNSADGGVETWMCPPGTYFCDFAQPGFCAQCQADADCANRALPTYDRKRPRCDLGSGIFGYQGFCQQCLENADCDGNAQGDFCDLIPPAQPPLDLIGLDLFGFEACGRTQTDCRSDGGPRCPTNTACSAATGICVGRSGLCQIDADCAGLVVNGNQAEPFCVAGQCSLCPAAGCPPPCRGDKDCSDAGLSCLYEGTSSAYCGIRCSSPLAAPCPSDQPICESDSGFCSRCAFGDGCKLAGAAGGNACIDEGVCGCYDATDCPSGDLCLPGKESGGSCGAPPPRCTPASCGAFCDFDAGVCTEPGDQGHPGCITDYDCRTFNQMKGDFCVAGQCVQCRDNNDCAVPLGDHPYTLCCHAGDSACLGHAANTCVGACRGDADCIGNSGGPTCVPFEDGGIGTCQANVCRSNADCVGNPYGTYCDLDGGGPVFLRPSSLCGCVQDLDCPQGTRCAGDGTSLSLCTSYCYQDGRCPAGYVCDQSAWCRPRCDNGDSCPAPFSICDTQNSTGLNGITYSGTIPGLIWCYDCLTSDDCGPGFGCGGETGATHVCQTCGSDVDCSSGACLAGACLTPCDAGICPNGEVCDVRGDAVTRPGLCVQCLSAIDCPDNQGCNSATHTCGTCLAPTVLPTVFDCPPGDVCSSYWSGGTGVCLQPCDDRPCPADHPLCAVFPSFSPDRSFCFGCLNDSDCAASGPGAWCDTSVNLTFTCQLPLKQ